MAGAVGQRRLARNFALLSGGEMLAKVASFLAFTHLGRSLGPERYGSVEFVVAAIVFFSLPVAFGLEEYGARELAKSAGDSMLLAAEISALRMLLAFVSVAILAIVIWILPRPTEQKLLLAAWGVSLLLMPALGQWFFQGHNDMAWVSMLAIVRQSVFAFLVLFCFDPQGPLYRIGLFELAAVAATVAAGLYGLRRRFRLALPFARISAARMGGHLKAAIPIGLSQLTWAGLWYAATLILGFWQPPRVLGDFGVAHRITLSLHTFVWLYFFNLLPSISRVANETAEGGKLSELLSQSLRITSWAGFLVALAVAAAAGPMVSLAFGTAFAGSAPVLAALIAMIPVTLISGHYRFTLIATGHQNWLLHWSLAALAVTLASALLLVPDWGAVGAAWALLAGSVVQLILTYVTVRRHIVRLPAFRLWLPAGLASCAAWMAYRALSPINLPASVLTAAAIYLAALWFFERERIAVEWAQLWQTREHAA